jgi:hypothetical protein
MIRLDLDEQQGKDLMAAMFAASIHLADHLQAIEAPDKREARIKHLGACKMVMEALGEQGFWVSIVGEKSP